MRDSNLNEYNKFNVYADVISFRLLLNRELANNVTDRVG